MLNILLVAPHPFYVERGTPIAVRILAETLCGFGSRVDLLTYHEGMDVEIEGLRIIRIPNVPGIRNIPVGFSLKKLVCDAILCVYLWRLAWKNDYQVIHAVEESVFPALVLKRRKGPVIIYDMDSSMADQILEKWPWLKLFSVVLYWFEKMAIRRSDIIMPVCRHLADKAARIAPGKAVYVVEDVPLDRDASPGSVEDLRRKLGIEGILALYAGNLEHYQGIDLLVDSIAMLEKDSGIGVVVIGGAERDIAHYRQKCAQSGLAGRIHFIGARPVGQLVSYLEQADILLSPRIRGENTPMKIYSYMATGKAILATDIGSHTQVLDNSRALLVSAQPESFAGGLVQLASSPELRRDIGAGARRTVDRHYSRAAYREKVRAVYNTISGGNGE